MTIRLLTYRAIFMVLCLCSDAHHVTYIQTDTRPPDQKLFHSSFTRSLLKRINSLHQISHIIIFLLYVRNFSVRVSHTQLGQLFWFLHYVWIGWYAVLFGYIFSAFFVRPICQRHKFFYHPSLMST